MPTEKECNSHFCEEKIFSENDVKKALLAMKKKIIGEGISAFEDDPRYKMLTQCKTNVTTVFDEERCNRLNPIKQSTVKQSTVKQSNIREWFHKTNNKHVKTSDKDWEPYTGPRHHKDNANPYYFPFFTVWRGLTEEYMEDGMTKGEAEKKVVKNMNKYESDYKRKLQKWGERNRKEQEKATKNAKKKSPPKTRSKRCPNGTRRNKKTGECEKK